MMGSFFPRKNGGSNSCAKAIDWLKRNTVPGKGIAISSKKKEPYPEVTGYIIPTLYQWDEEEYADKLVSWLISVQNDDGSFSAPDGTPYTFDTGQVVRGLLAALDSNPGVREALMNACDWILTQVKENGRITTPSTEMWGNRADDRIHVYVLPPLIEAGERLGKPKYCDASRRSLSFYKGLKDLSDFDMLSHFHSYVVEALVDLKETKLARNAMDKVAALQGTNGSVPAYRKTSWVCSTGLAQYAVIWFKLGEKERAEKALGFLEKVQNKSGGFFGSYGKGGEYFPKEEISWAAKFFLDAQFLRSGGRSRT